MKKRGKSVMMILEEFGQVAVEIGEGQFRHFRSIIPS
jgi:hypothetical protein